MNKTLLIAILFCACVGLLAQNLYLESLYENRIDNIEMLTDQLNNCK